MKLEEIKNIVLIDDDEATNFINKEIIRSINESWIIKEINSSFDGIEYLIGEYSTLKNGTIIFLDLNLPGYDGWGILNQVQKSLLTKQKNDGVKLFILTSSKNPSEFTKSKNYWILDGIISKPLTPEKILRKVII